MTSLELLKEIEAWLCFNTEPSKEETAKLRKSINEHVSEQSRLHSVSNCVATEYADFCVRCDREKLPLLCLEDYIKQYCD